MTRRQRLGLHLWAASFPLILLMAICGVHFLVIAVVGGKYA